MLLLGGFSLCFVAVLRSQLLACETGMGLETVHYDPEYADFIQKERMDYLANKVKTGSIAFLKEEYKYLSAYVSCWFVVIIVLFSIKGIAQHPDADDGTDGVRCAATFLMGAALSALSGFIGMTVATDGNVRTTVACAKGTLNDGLRVAFKTGAAMGFGVVGLAMIGFSIMLILMTLNRSIVDAIRYMHSFGFGASSIALFARVAGGIYTKAADVGADLVGKVEAGIDEDDPRNPAVIADNVGDNVGDVAGMGADLFESYIGSVIGAATLGASQHAAFVAFPCWLSAVGLVSSFVGFFFVSTNEKGEGINCNLSALMWALDKGLLVANVLFVILAAVCVVMLFGADNEDGWKLLICVVVGMVTGMAIGKGTEYFTSFDYGPTISIKDRARTGPATVIIQGIGVGMISTLLPTIFLVICILVCAGLSGEYGVAIAAVGMLGTLAISLSTDAYGPVADNAGGLAEMAHLKSEVRDKTDSLDALGNTTAAIGKGFAVGSAVLTALSLLAAFKEEVCHGENTVCYTSEDGLSGHGAAHAISTGEEPLMMIFEVSEPILLAGVLMGAMLPYLFGALTMLSVGKAAAEMIEEVRRQFHNIKNKKGETLGDIIRRSCAGDKILPEDEPEPDSDRCVLISTRSSVKEMLAPGLYAVMTPLIAGFMVGPRAVMGMLAGCIGSAAMLAVMMGNAGGAWDNSKKLCEKMKLKKTEQGKACVVGDTVGDPFKDTSGPSLDILLKLMAMVSLMIAPLLQDRDDWQDAWQGAIPLVICLGGTGALISKGILTWEDPLAAEAIGEAPAAVASNKVATDSQLRDAGGGAAPPTTVTAPTKQGKSDPALPGGVAAPAP
jgi:inorganic pyrophosphatase